MKIEVYPSVRHKNRGTSYTFLRFPTLRHTPETRSTSDFPTLSYTSYTSPTLTPPRRLSQLIRRSQPFRRTFPFFCPTTSRKQSLFNPKSYAFLHFPTLRYAPETRSTSDFPTLSYTSYASPTLSAPTSFTTDLPLTIFSPNFPTIFLPGSLARLFATFHNLFAAALHNRLFFAELSPFSALRPLGNNPFLIPNPTLSYTFLRYGIHLKPAPHLTFLHFPTLPTLPTTLFPPAVFHD
jgi:hypothetical protein